MGADSLLWGTIGEESVSIRTGPDEEHTIGEKVDAFFQPAAPPSSTPTPAPVSESSSPEDTLS